jgi:hypothetical protein
LSGWVFLAALEKQVPLCVPRPLNCAGKEKARDSVRDADELPWLCSVLDRADIAIVEATPFDSYSRRLCGKPMFNAGVILYGSNDRISQWVQEWAAISERNFWLAETTPPGIVATLSHITDENTRRRLLCMDQVGLLEILSLETNRIGLAVQKLDDCWNYRRPLLH